MTRRARLLLPDHVLTAPARTALRPGWAVLVEGRTVVDLGPAARLKAEHPAAEDLELAGCVLLPGLINAHQHGRGLSQLQLGFPDRPLERWINARRRRGAVDGGAFVRLCCAQMLENGVTSAVHANYAYGTGEYEAEARAQLDAYIDAGVRVTFCVGAQDRGLVVYPPFTIDDLGPLPAAADHYVRSLRSPYAPDAATLLRLMDRLLADYGDHPRVTLCWGPAGPQWVSDGLLTGIVAHARANGLGLHLHVLESPVQAAVCGRLFPKGTLAHLRDAGALTPRTVLAHGVHLDDADIACLAEAGALVAHNPGSNLRLANGIAPITRLSARGIDIALGTDNTALADDEDLLGELKLMASLAADTARGDGSIDAERLLEAVTTAGARAMQEPERLGRIAIGLPADLTAIDLGFTCGAYLDDDMDLVTAVARRARGRDVRLTMVDGQLLYRDGCLTDLDRDKLEADAAEAARRARRASNPEADLLTDALDEALVRLYAPLLTTGTTPP